MRTLVALAFFASADAAAPVPLAALAVERATALDGQSVVVTLTVGKPAYTWGEGAAVRTVVGTADADDGIERTVVLKGDRLKDVDRGSKLKVNGTLRVIRHPPVVVGGALVEAWVEIRVEEE